MEWTSQINLYTLDFRQNHGTSIETMKANSCAKLPDEKQRTNNNRTLFILSLIFHAAFTHTLILPSNEIIGLIHKRAYCIYIQCIYDADGQGWMPIQPWKVRKAKDIVFTAITMIGHNLFSIVACAFNIYIVYNRNGFIKITYIIFIICVWTILIIFIAKITANVFNVTTVCDYLILPISMTGFITQATTCRTWKVYISCRTVRKSICNSNQYRLGRTTKCLIGNSGRGYILLGNGHSMKNVENHWGKQPSRGKGHLYRITKQKHRRWFSRMSIQLTPIFQCSWWFCLQWIFCGICSVEILPLRFYHCVFSRFIWCSRGLF